MISIHAAASLSFTQVDPIRSPITRPRKAGAIDQSFEQQGAIAIKRLPVQGKLTCCQRENLARQASNRNPRKYQETAVRNDVLKIASTLLIGPIDPRIARRHFPGGAGKLQAGKKSAGDLLGLDEVAQVGAERNAIAQIMPAVDELLKGRTELAVGSLDELQRQGLELSDAAGDGRLRIALGGGDDSTRASGGGGAKLGKRNKAVSLKALEESSAFFVLQFAVGALPFEEFAQCVGDLGQAEVGKALGDLANEIDLAGRKGASRGLDIGLNHGRTLGCLYYPMRDLEGCPAKNAIIFSPTECRDGKGFPRRYKDAEETCNEAGPAGAVLYYSSAANERRKGVSLPSSRK